MYSSEINNESERADFIRKGNELFNKGDILLAYKCYTMAGYHAGIEKVADHYFYNEKSPAKAIVLYKKLAKETGSERVQAKLDEVAQKIVKVIRKWVAEDIENANKEASQTSIEKKRQYLSNVIDEQKNKFHTRTEINKNNTINKKATTPNPTAAAEPKSEANTKTSTNTKNTANITNTTKNDTKNTNGAIKEAPFPFNKFNKNNKK